MARIRTVKPEFWSSEQVMECSPMARLLFIGMWNFCDDGGRHRASVKTLKAEVFPSDSIGTHEISKMILELVTNGLLDEYEAAGERYWQVTGWKHQRVDQPTYKHPGKNGVVERSPNRRRTDAECSPPERNGTESKGTEGNGVEGNGMEGNVKPGGAGIFRMVTREILESNEQLSAWLEEAQSKKPPAVERSEASQLRVFGAAVHALDIGTNAAALFVKTVKSKSWGVITLEQEDAARRRLREFRESTGPPGALVESLVSKMFKKV